MKRPTQYFKSTKVLFDAIRNETLFHNSYGCCADGHLIAAAMNYRVSVQFYGKGVVVAHWNGLIDNKDNYVNSWKWGRMLLYRNIFYYAYLHLKMSSTDYRLQKKHIDSTGYSPKELVKIMQAFDFCYDGEDQTKNILPALKNVLQVLKQIHQVNHFDIQQVYRKEFALENHTLATLPERNQWLVKLENKEGNGKMQSQPIRTGPESAMVQEAL